MHFLLVRKLNGTSSIEELRSSSTIRRLIVEFDTLELIGLGARADTPRAETWLHSLRVGENLRIEEGQIVGAGSVEALVGVGVGRKLVYYAVRILRSCKELVCALVATLELRMGTSQIVYQLSATAWTFMTFLQLLFHHILRL